MDCKSTHFFVKYTTTLKKIDFQRQCLQWVVGMPSTQSPLFIFQADIVKLFADFCHLVQVMTIICLFNEAVQINGRKIPEMNENADSTSQFQPLTVKIGISRPNVR